MLGIITVLLPLTLLLSFGRHRFIVAGATMADITCNGLECSPEEVCACRGSDIKIPWQIPHSDEIFTVDWSIEDASGSVNSIVNQDASGSIIVSDGFNATHNGNGMITLTSVSVDNTGIYRCAITYNLNTYTPITGTVTISVYDAPTNLSYSKTVSGSKTTYTCTATFTGNPISSLGVQVDDKSRTSDIISVTENHGDIKCCITGVSVRCMDGSAPGCSTVSQCIPVVSGQIISTQHSDSAIVGMAVMAVIVMEKNS